MDIIGGTAVIPTVRSRKFHICIIFTCRFSNFFSVTRPLSLSPPTDPRAHHA